VIVIVMDVGFPSRVFLAKTMTAVERNKSHQFKYRSGTPHSTSASWSADAQTAAVVHTPNVLINSNELRTAGFKLKEVLPPSLEAVARVWTRGSGL